MLSNAKSIVNPDDFPVTGDIKDLFSTILITKNQVNESTDFIVNLLKALGPEPKKQEIELLMNIEKQFLALLHRNNDSTTDDNSRAELQEKISKHQQLLSRFLSYYGGLNQGFRTVANNIKKVDEDLQFSIEDMLKSEKGKAIEEAYQSMLVLFFTKYNMLETSSGEPNNLINTFDQTFQEMISLYIGTTAFSVSKTRVCLLCYKLITASDKKEDPNEQYCVPKSNHPAMIPITLIAKTTLRKDAFPLPVSFLDVMQYLHSMKHLFEGFEIYNILNHPNNQERLTYLPLPAIWSFQCEEMIKSHKMKNNNAAKAHKCMNKKDYLYKLNFSKPETFLNDWSNFMNKGNYSSESYSAKWFEEIQSYLKGQHPKAVAKLNGLSNNQSKAVASRSQSRSLVEVVKNEAELAVLKKMATQQKLKMFQVPDDTLKMFIATNGVLSQYNTKQKDIQIYCLDKESSKTYKKELDEVHNEAKMKHFGKPSVAQGVEMTNFLGESNKDAQQEEQKEVQNLDRSFPNDQNSQPPVDVLPEQEASASSTKPRDLPDFERVVYRPKSSTENNNPAPENPVFCSTGLKGLNRVPENESKLAFLRSSVEIRKNKNKKEPPSTKNIDHHTSTELQKDDEASIHMYSSSFQRDEGQIRSNFKPTRSLRSACVEQDPKLQLSGRIN